METNLEISVVKDLADYRRLDPNSLWQYIREDIEDYYFGALAHIVRGKLVNDTYLKSCYIEDFADHRDEVKYSRQFEELVKQNINFYSDIKSWLDKKQPYMASKMGLLDSLNPNEWKSLTQPRMLCGRISSGKTTLLMHTKSDIEKKSKTICLFVHLANTAPELDDPWSYCKTKIIQQLDNLAREYRTRDGMSDKDMVIKRHERIWRDIDAYPDENDSSTEAELKRSARDNILNKLFDSKYTFEFTQYFLDTIEFLEKSFNLKVVVMIDDVDRLQSEEVAKEICERAKGLAGELGVVPILVSIREETMVKLSDIGFASRYSIIPPSFSKVLSKRLEVFLEDFQMDDATIQKSGYDTDEVKTFVKHVVESVLETATYVNLIAYHYEVDTLLDVVRCLIGSPFIEPKYVRDLYKKKEKIPWHIVLDSMQRFQYKNFYDENSFILNMFDNDQIPATMSNALIRCRLLQILRYRFKGLNTLVPLGEIYSDMKELGYNREAVQFALRAFARQRLIMTRRQYNAFEVDVRDMLLEPTIVYYLDSLIFSYRYLQNILPVTHIPFYIPPDIIEATEPIAGEKLKLVSELIMKFVSFIRECEKNEKGHVQNEVLFKEVTRDETLSNIMETKLKREISRMKG